MRIAWFIHGAEQYGVRETVLSLTQELRVRDWDTPIISCGWGPFGDELRALGYHVIRATEYAPPLLTGNSAHKLAQLPSLHTYTKMAVPALTAVANDLGVDAHHVLWPHLLPAASSAGQRRGVPTFWEMPNIVGKGYPMQLNKRLLRRSIRRNNVVPMPTSDYVSETLGFPTAVECVPLGIDIDRFHPMQPDAWHRKQLDVPEDAIVAAIVARLDPSKGQHLAIAAVHALRDEGWDVHLVLAGQGDANHVAALQSQASDLGISRACHFIGHVPRPERFYPVVDLALNLRVDPEPFGLSVIEAMAMKVPTLVHALGGPAETVVDGITGWHIANPSESAVIGGLRRALAARAQWPLMGVNARERVLEQYSLKRRVDRYTDIVSHTVLRPELVD